MKLKDIVRKEMNLGNWKEESELVDRVLVRLNHLHADAVQKVLLLESQIREAGGKPIVKVEITWPEPPPMPEPEPPEEELWLP